MNEIKRFAFVILQEFAEVKNNDVIMKIVKKRNALNQHLEESMQADREEYFEKHPFFQEIFKA